MAASALAVLLHLPIAFAYTGNTPLLSPNFNSTNTGTSNPVAVHSKSAALLMYDSIGLQNAGLSFEAFEYAMYGYQQLRTKGRLSNKSIITIVDFSQASNKKRLYVIDLSASKILFNTYVAHGQNTGREFAKQFSNKAESHQSSLGFYVTSGTYMGSNGFSMYLNGMERGINDNAMERAIVMHGADYVSEQMIRSQGYIGRSHGCPAVPLKWNKAIIARIKNGSCLFVYSNNSAYLNKSKLLNS